MKTNMEGQTWKAKRMRKEKKRDIEMERNFFLKKNGKNSTNQIAVFRSRDPRGGQETKISIIRQNTKF